MAFQYRNTLDNALASLPQKFSDQALADVGDKIIKTTVTATKLFAFKTSPEIQELLSECGIEMAPVAYMTHSHPACKMIENQLLYVVLPNLLRNESSVGLLSLRESKHKKFIKMRRFLKFGEFQNEKMFNASIDAKDFFRYGTPPSEDALDERLERIIAEYQDGFNARTMLMHDELHFHSPDSIANFFEKVPLLQTLVCTTVCPVELLRGETKSKNPRVYGFEVCGDNLHFFPDCCPSEGYVQPISTSIWPLLTKQIVKGDLTLRVTILQTIFAHHLVSIERTKVESQSEKFYRKPSCLLEEELRILSEEMKTSTVERKTMGSIMLYLSCLKSPNQESALAKLRQLEKRELFQDEMRLISAVASTFDKVKGWQSLTLSIVEQVKRSLCSSFPWVSSFVFEDTVWKETYNKFMRELSTKWFKVELKVVKIQNGAYFSFDRFKRMGREMDQKKKNHYAPQRSDGEWRKKDRVPTLNIGKEKEVVIGSEKVDLGPGMSVDRGEIAVSSGTNNDELTGFELSDEDRVPTDDNGCIGGVAQCRAINMDEEPLKFKPDRFRKNSCVIRSIAPQMNMSPDELLALLYSSDMPDGLMECLDQDIRLGVREVAIIANLIGRNLRCMYSGNEVSLGRGGQVFLNLEKDHCTPLDGSLFEKKDSRPELDSLGSVVIKICPDSAIKLAKSLERGTTGILVQESEKAKEGVKRAIKVAECIGKERIAEMNYMWGAPGSGKTKGIMDKLKTDESIIALVISPRRLLADSWSDALRHTNSRVTTFESFYGIDSAKFNCIVIDEISLMPPGSVDLVICKVMADRIARPLSGFGSGLKVSQEKWSKVMMSVRFSLIGDPMQARYYSPDDEILLSRISDIDRIVCSGANKTLWKTHRMGRWFEEVMEIPCLKVTQTDNDEFKIWTGFSAIKGRDYDAILCAGREDKRDFAGPIPCFTFGEAQGLTFNRCLIALTDSLHKVNDYHMFVGLTRSVNKFDFIINSEKSIEHYAIGLKGKLMGYVLKREIIPRERLKNMFKKTEPVFVVEDRFGANIQEKSVNDLFIQPFCDLSDTIEIEEPHPEEEESAYEFLKSHLPVVNHNPILPDVFDRIRLKESREAFKEGLGYSEQFIDVDKGIVKEVIGLPMRMESIFPRHKADDNVTFLMAVKKRLRFSNPIEQRAEFRNLIGKGEELADFFIKKLPVKLKVCQEDIEVASNEFIEKRLQKNSAQWLNHNERSDIDWPLNRVFLFMKSQLCTKYEKMYVDAKAGQTLACFQHIVLFKFGPMLRAIEKAFERSCGENFYIHSGKNFDALNEWVKERAHKNKINESVESDYEAFDSSQDGLILAFEVALLKKMGVMQEFISDYIDLKVNLGSKIGNFAIMRFTGEFCTFLFNTMANMLFTFLTYNVTSQSYILFAGDDMASIGKLNVDKDDWKVRQLKNFRLKAKVVRQDYPMFCGWKLTPDGIYKMPELLWARINVMSERGLLRDCIDNYLLELKYGYQMSEKLFGYLDERQMEFHYCAVRFFVEKSYMCKGESVKVLKSFGSTFGSEGDVEMVKRYRFDFIAESLTRGRRGLEIYKTAQDVVMKCNFKIDVERKAENWFGVKKDSNANFVNLMGKEPVFKSLNVERLCGQKVRDALNDFKREPFLGQGVFSLIKESLPKVESKCQLYESMNYTYDPRVIISRLIPYSLLRSMGTQTSCIQRFSTALEDLSQILKSELKILTGLFYQNSQSLMMANWIGLGVKLVNTTMSILELFLYASVLLCRTSNILLVRPLLLTPQCMMRGWHLLQAMSSISKRGLALFSSDQHTAYQLQTNTCRELFKLHSDLRDSDVTQVERLLQLMLVFSTGYQTVQDFSLADLEAQVGCNRRFAEFKDFSLTKKYLMDLEHGKRQPLNPLKLVRKQDQGEYLCLNEYLEPEATESARKGRKGLEENQGKKKLSQAELDMEEMLKLMKMRLGCLGHPRLNLKECQNKYSENMSLKEVMRGEIRAQLRRFLWVNHVDPEHNLIALENLPNLPAEPEGDNFVIYDTVLNHFCEYLFGNVAIIGTSTKVIWPNVNVPIPALNFRVGEAGADDAQQINWVTEMNMSVIVPGIVAWKEASNVPHIRHGTLRYICEPFADFARRFLNARKAQGVTTNIYEKWPKAFELAPQVAFDFAGGLNMMSLSADERMVIDKMTKRLFRTENQKMVFNAQGEVNITMEG